MPAKPEGVGEGIVDIPLRRNVGRKLEVGVDGLIAVFQIDGGWDDPLLDSHDAGQGLYGARSPEEVPRHALGRAYADLGGVLPKYLLYGFEFSHIAQRG